MSCGMLCRDTGHKALLSEFEALNPTAAYVSEVVQQGTSRLGSPQHLLDSWATRMPQTHDKRLDFVRCSGNFGQTTMRIRRPLL